MYIYILHIILYIIYLFTVVKGGTPSALLFNKEDLGLLMTSS